VCLDSQPLPKGVPENIIQSPWLADSGDIALSDANIFLADFGESFLPSTTSRYYSNTWGSYVPPELYFLPRESLSFPSDIWALACTIWAIMGSLPLFCGIDTSADLMIKEHVGLLGKLPPEWWRKWEDRLTWFSEEGEEIDMWMSTSWKAHWEFSVQAPRRKFKMEEIGEEEKAALFDMLKAMLAFEPGKRITVDQVKESEWMTKWTLPELGKLKRIPRQSID
jgi:serine/threonine-protein kinase SRPK3